eukprot:NODE_613_length_5385_cov_1.452138.p3 type:complete len:237 gc:universal NODE_613_length_5385_cov_1.452138:3917-3207(-)
MILTAILFANLLNPGEKLKSAAKIAAAFASNIVSEAIPSGSIPFDDLMECLKIGGSTCTEYTEILKQALKGPTSHLKDFQTKVGDAILNDGLPEEIETNHSLARSMPKAPNSERMERLKKRVLPQYTTEVPNPTTTEVPKPSYRPIFDQIRQFEAKLSRCQKYVFRCVGVGASVLAVGSVGMFFIGLLSLYTTTTFGLTHLEAQAMALVGAFLVGSYGGFGFALSAAHQLRRLVDQ